MCNCGEKERRGRERESMGEERADVSIKSGLRQIDRHIDRQIDL